MNDFGWDGSRRVRDPRLRAKLYPLSPASRNVKRIFRRMRHYGGGTPPFDSRGNRRPCTFRGMVGMVLQRMAAHRKARR